ncbi:MAG: hypothetical protein MR009_09000 [Sutterellaceae bacterium]|nr:hypothetical protein [Sutterellaceae bacterium]MDD7442609.1 hypothetical protein [Sutterellaceae bacterium]MDY2868442.1 hypothetical protein [Mesosutterella sp.]
MKTLWNRGLVIPLRRAASRARTIVLVTPYVKRRALEAVLRPGLPFESLTLVTRCDLDDFAAGLSDLDALSDIWALGGSVCGIPNLHAKYYRFDKDVFLGSANLTGRGIGVGLDGKWNSEVLAWANRSSETEALEAAWAGASEFVPPESEPELRRKVEKRRRDGFLGDYLTRWAAHEAARLPPSWIPSTPHPELLWEADHRTSLRHFLPWDEDEALVRRLTQEDLAVLDPPRGLRNEAELSLYAGIRLRRSRFFRDVKELFDSETSDFRPFLGFGALRALAESGRYRLLLRPYDQVEAAARSLVYFLPGLFYFPGGCRNAIARRAGAPEPFRSAGRRAN